MFGKIFQALMAALPGILKIISLFRKKSYTSEDIQSTSGKELDALDNWRDSDKEDRRIIKGED